MAIFNSKLLVYQRANAYIAWFIAMQCFAWTMWCHISNFFRGINLWIILNRFRSTQLSAGWYDSILYLYYNSLSLELHPKSVQKSCLPNHAKASCELPWAGEQKMSPLRRKLANRLKAIEGDGALANLVKGCWRTKIQALFVVGVTSKRVPLNQLTYNIYI